MDTRTIPAQEEISRRLVALNQAYKWYREAKRYERDEAHKAFNEAQHWFTVHGLELLHTLPNDPWTLLTPPPTEQEIKDKLAALKPAYDAMKEDPKTFDEIYDWLKKHHIEYRYEQESGSFQQMQ